MADRNEDVNLNYSPHMIIKKMKNVMFVLFIEMMNIAVNERLKKIAIFL